METSIDNFLEEIKESIEKDFGSNYQNIQYWKDGGTRHLFRAEWGPGKEKRVIKVDKADMSLASPRAKRHVARGCTTINDVMTLSTIPNAEQHGLMRLLDYRELNALGEKRTASVESYFESESLEERVHNYGPMSKKEAIDTFGQLIHASSYFVNETGKLHRDLKPSNILIGSKEQKGKLRITDFSNSAKKEDIQVKVDPTAGSIQVTDWQLMHEFTGNPAAYTEQSEVYSLGMNLLYMLSGKQTININPDTKEASDLRGESLLDKNGLIDKSKYEQAMANAITVAADNNLHQILRRSLTSDMSERYTSVKEMVKDFEEVTKPTLWERLTSSWKALTATTLAANTLAFGAYKYDQHMKKETNKAIAEASKYRVKENIDSKDLEISNNLYEMQLSVYSSGQSYPQQKAIFATDTNKNMYVQVYAQEFARTFPTNKFEETKGKELPTNYRIPARLYLEGVPTNQFPIEKTFIYPMKITSAYSESYYGGGFGTQSLTNVPDGTYVLAVEFLSPSTNMRDSDTLKHLEQVSYSQEGVVIARKRVPIVVGNPKSALHFNYGMFGYSDCINRDNLKDDASDAGVLNDAYFEKHGHMITDGQRGTLRLPFPKENVVNGEERILYVFARKDDEILNFTALPLQATVMKYNNSSPYVEWNPTPPKEDFPYKLIEFRKQYEQLHQKAR